MKIAIDVSQIVYEDTGVGNYTRNITKHLLNIARDHEFVFFAGVRNLKHTINKYAIETPWRKAEWLIRPIPPKVAAYLFNKTPLPIEAIIGNFDIFHASDWTHPNSRKPTITTVHDLAFEKYTSTVDPLVASTQNARLLKVANHASHIIVDSNSTKKDLEEIYGIDPARMTTIHLACEDIFKPQKKSEIDRVKKSYGIEGDYILTLGTLEPRKNLQRAVDAFRALKNTKKHEDMKLVVAGRHGWGKKLNVGDGGIIMTGHIKLLDLPALYSGASVFLYPSLYEGFGIPVLEAMSCGIPVVTSDRSSLPEITGDSGVLIDPESVPEIVRGIERALRRSSSYASDALKQASSFSWNKTAKKTLEVYTNVYEANY